MGLNIFKQQLSEKTLVLDFIKTFEDDHISVAQSICDLINNSPLAKKRIKLTKQIIIKISTWLFALQILPILIFFEDPLKKSIFSKTLHGATLTLKVNELDLLESVKTIVRFYFENQGEYSRAFINELSHEASSDPVLRLAIETYIAEYSYKWKKAKDEFNIIHDYL